MPLRVYYEDTDASGIVYYANYLKFAERGRTEMMRVLGFAHSEIFAETGIAFTVRRLSADYRAPARLDDALTIDTSIVEIGGATLLLHQRVCRAGCARPPPASRRRSGRAARSTISTTASASARSTR